MVKTFIRKRSSKADGNPLKETAPVVHKMRKNPEKFLKRSQFKGLSEMRNAQKISVVNKFESINLLPYSFDNDEIGSYFFDELERSHAIEQSKEWYALYTNLAPISQNLSLILLNKNRVFDELTAGLDSQYQKRVVLKLLLALLRDLRGEGFQYFFDNVFGKVVDSIGRNDEVLEAGVQLIGGFIKYCNKAIVSRLESFVASIIAIALSENRPKHISRILAEVLAYLCKRSLEAKTAASILNLIGVNIFASVSQRADFGEFQGNKVVYFLSCLLFETFKGHENTMDERVNASMRAIFDMLMLIQEQGPDETEMANFLSITQKSLRCAFYKLMKVEFKFVNKPRKDQSQTISDLARIILANYFDQPSLFWFNLIADLLADAIIFREGILFKDAFRSLLKGYIDQIGDKCLGQSQVYLVACYIYRFKTAPVSLATLFNSSLITTEQLQDFVLELINHSQKASSNRSIFNNKQILTYEDFAPSALMSTEILRELIGVALEHFSAKSNYGECLEIFYIIAFLLRANSLIEKVHLKDSVIEAKFIQLGKQLCVSGSSDKITWLKEALCVTAVFSVVSFGGSSTQIEYLDCLAQLFQLTVSKLTSIKPENDLRSEMESRLIQDQEVLRNLNLLNLFSIPENVMLCDLFSCVSDLLLTFKVSLATTAGKKLSLFGSTRKCLDNLEDSLNQVLVHIRHIPHAFAVVSKSQKLQKILMPATREYYTSMAVFMLYSQKSLHRFQALSFLQSNPEYNRQFKEIGFIDFLIRVK